MAVTIQESSEGLCEKAIRIARMDGLETSSSTARWSSPGGAENDKTLKANELVRSLVGRRKKEETISVSLAESQNCGET